MNRRRLKVLGLMSVAALLLVACTPEPPAPPPPPPPPAHPECGSVDTSAAADSYAVTYDDGGRRHATQIKANDAFEKIDKLRAIESQGKHIVAVAPEQVVTTAAADGPSNDPYFSPGAGGGPQLGEWGIDAVNAPQAWGSGTLQQGQGVTVAVVDTGVQASHAGLAGRVIAGADFIAPAPFDGRVDGNGHGTHVAGIIAENDDAVGGVGVAPQVTILPVRVLGCTGSGSSSNVAKGIYYAIAQHAQVINMSLGTTGPDTTIQLAVEAALRADIVVVAAGGNGGATSCSTPASTVVTVPPTVAPTLPVASTTTTPTTPVSVPSAAVTTPTTAATALTTTSTTGASGVTPTTATTVPAPVTTTTTTTELPPTTTAAPEAAPAPVAVEGVVDELTAVPAPCSAPLYPAALALGRPGLIAVAATGNTVAVNVPASSPANVTGALTWHKNVGDWVDAGGVLATVGATDLESPIKGALTARLVADGATVTNTSALALAQLLTADARADYSNVNDYITVAAPGGGVPSANLGIWSTIPTAPFYGYKSGTSMASPHVAGVAALIRAKCPTLSAAGVRAAITSNARDLGPVGWDPAYGAGLVDAKAAVAAAC